MRARKAWKRARLMLQGSRVSECPKREGRRTAGGVVEDTAGVQLEGAVVGLDGGGDLRAGRGREKTKEKAASSEKQRQEAQARCSCSRTPLLP